MTKIYFNSFNAATTAYPELAPITNGKSHEQQGRIYTKIATAIEKHDQLWQVAHLAQAVAFSILALLVIPLFISSYRKQTIQLWNRGTSGIEKISLYNIDAQAEARREKQHALDEIRKNATAFQQLSPEMRDDEEVALAAIQASTLNVVQYASSRLKNMKKIALPAVQKNAHNYRHLSDAMRDDEEILFEAIKSATFDILGYASDRLKDRKTVAIPAVQKVASNYQHLSLNMRQDKEVTLAAINNCFEPVQEEILRFSSVELQNDKDIQEAARTREPHIASLKAKREEVQRQYRMYCEQIKQQQEQEQAQQQYQSAQYYAQHFNTYPTYPSFNTYSYPQFNPNPAPNIFYTYYPYFNSAPGYQYTYFYPQTVPTPVQPPMWVCPPELEKDNTPSGAIIRRILQEGVQSGVNFDDVQKNTSAHGNTSIIFKDVLCKMLNLPKDSSEQTIKATYRKQVIHLHPDKRGDDVYAKQAFHYLSTAYSAAQL